MFLKEIWRYPVKSMAGERLPGATLTTEGILGDRIAQVRSANGRLVTARTHPLLLRRRAVLGPGREPLVDGSPWREVDVQTEAGPGSQIVLASPETRFDIQPLLIATDGALNAINEDYRRFRPNLIIGGVEGLAERDWEGKVMRVRDTLIHIADLRGRCVMTTFHPDTLKQDHNVLRRIARNFNGVLGLNAAVLQGGPIAVGDPVEILSAGDSR